MANLTNLQFYFSRVAEPNVTDDIFIKVYDGWTTPTSGVLGNLLYSTSFDITTIPNTGVYTLMNFPLNINSDNFVVVVEPTGHGTGVAGDVDMVYVMGYYFTETYSQGQGLGGKVEYPLGVERADVYPYGAFTVRPFWPSLWMGWTIDGSSDTTTFEGDTYPFLLSQESSVSPYSAYSRRLSGEIFTHDIATSTLQEFSFYVKRVGDLAFFNNVDVKVNGNILGTFDINALGPTWEKITIDCGDALANKAGYLGNFEVQIVPHGIWDSDPSSDPILSSGYLYIQTFLSSAPSTKWDDYPFSGSGSNGNDLYSFFVANNQDEWTRQNPSGPSEDVLFRYYAKDKGGGSVQYTGQSTRCILFYTPGPVARVTNFIPLPSTATTSGIPQTITWEDQYLGTYQQCYAYDVEIDQRWFDDNFNFFWVEGLLEHGTTDFSADLPINIQELLGHGTGVYLGAGTTTYVQAKGWNDYDDDTDNGWWITPLTAPAKAVNPSIEDGSNGVAPNIAIAPLTWEDGDPGGPLEADYYIVNFGTDFPGPDYEADPNNTSLSWTIPENISQLMGDIPKHWLNSLQGYEWRIDSVNGAGTTIGDIWEFTTSAYRGLGKSRNPTPEDTETGVSSTRSTLSWEGCEGSTRNSLYIGESPSTMSFYREVGSNLEIDITKFGLNIGQVYYWRVDTARSIASPFDASITGDLWWFLSDAEGTGLPGGFANGPLFGMDVGGLPVIRLLTVLTDTALWYEDLI